MTTGRFKYTVVNIVICSSFLFGIIAALQVPLNGTIEQSSDLEPSEGSEEKIEEFAVAENNTSSDTKDNLKYEINELVDENKESTEKVADSEKRQEALTEVDDTQNEIEFIFHGNVTKKDEELVNETPSFNELSYNVTNSPEYDEGIISSGNGSIDLETVERPSSEKMSSPFVDTNTSAAILAISFLCMALVGYAGLMVWRKILWKRYGNSEMLITEEEFYDVSDLRDFEI